MEALTGVSTALLTIYDMCKALDKSMEISGIYPVSYTHLDVYKRQGCWKYRPEPIHKEV